MYRFFYEEYLRHSISGVVLANSYKEAVSKTTRYLTAQFSDINPNMNFIVSSDEACLDKDKTLWVWPCRYDDDYNEDNPDCIAVSY